MRNNYYVYIAANRSQTLYVGVTNNLERRTLEHRFRQSSFTSKYRIDRVVYFEHTPDIWAAIRREKQLKGWVRRKKVNLIESQNPGWLDLLEGYSRSFDTFAEANGSG
jgi:putative endonuclease